MINAIFNNSSLSWKCWKTFLCWSRYIRDPILSSHELFRYGTADWHSVQRYDSDSLSPKIYEIMCTKGFVVFIETLPKMDWEKQKITEHRRAAWMCVGSKTIGNINSSSNSIAAFFLFLPLFFSFYFISFRDLSNSRSNKHLWFIHSTFLIFFRLSFQISYCLTACIVMDQRWALSSSTRLVSRLRRWSLSLLVERVLFWSFSSLSHSINNLKSDW